MTRSSAPDKDSKAKQAMALRLEGKSYAAIGKIMGLSRQRVQQITKPPQELWTAVYMAAKGLCQDCGISPPVGHGHLHHIEQRTENYNAVENLCFLCASCHRLHHVTPWHPHYRGHTVAHSK
jgi:hypothetical protein